MGFTVTNLDDENTRLVRWGGEVAPEPPGYDHVAAVTLGTPGTADAAARWAVVDEISCALTVCLALPVPALERPADVQRALERVVERYLGAPGVARPGLVRRPALQLLVCPAEPLVGGAVQLVGSAVELAARALETRVGLALPDFRVVLGEEVALPPSGVQGLASLPERARAFHLRFLRALGSETRPDATPMVRSLTAGVSQSNERLALAAQALLQADATWPPPAEALEGVLTQLQTVIGSIRIIGQSQGAATSSEPTMVAPMPIPLQLRVQARRWAGPAPVVSPARLPLANLTLAVGENASGKTSALEALTLLSAGVPRARVRPPTGSERLGGTAQLDILVAPEASWGHACLLPLFADDADLAGGQVGEVALATAWPSSNALDLVGEIGRQRRQLGEVLERARRLSDRLNAPIEPGPPVAQFTRRGPIRWAIGRWITERRPEAAVEAHAPRPSSEAPKEGSEARRQQALWGALESDLQQRTKHFRRTSPRLTITGARLAPLADDLGPWLAQDYEAGGVSWTELHQTLADLGRWDVLFRIGARLLKERVRLIEEAVALWDDTLNTVVEEQLAEAGHLERLQELVKSIDDLLDHRVRPGDERPNTAAQVRRSLAERLARALLFSPHGLPLVAMDEPTLGQHETASARSMARLTRLARTLEAARWLDARPSPADPPWVQLSPVELRRVEADDERLPGQTSASLPTLRVGAELRLRPPPVLVLSYGRAALSALASLEGAPLDHGLGERLRKLIPSAWRGPVAARVRQEVERWRQAAPGSEAPTPPALLSQVLLREDTWEEDSLKALSLNEGETRTWWDACSKAAVELGIRTLLPREEPGQGAPARGLARRLVGWLALTELLPAAFEDGALHLDTTAMRLVQLRAEGGICHEEGPRRVRRVSPIMVALPVLEPSTQHHDGATPLEPDRPAAPARSAPEPTSTEAGLTSRSAAPIPGVAPLLAVGLVLRPPGRTQTLYDTLKAALEEVGLAVVSERAAAEAPHPTLTVLDDPDEEAAELSTSPSDRARVPRDPERSAESKKLRRNAQTLALRAALRAWRARAEEPAELHIGLWSGEFAWDGGPVHLLLNADVRDPQGVATRFGPDLDVVQAAMAEQKPARLVLHLRVPPGVAVRAGWVFREVSRIPVKVMAGARGQAEASWDLEEPDSEEPIPEPRIDGPDPDEAGELHVVVLITPRADLQAYLSWLKATPRSGPQARRLLWDQKVDLRDPGQIARWADQIVQRIGRESRRKGEQIARLFISGPDSLAFAIGRRLNAMGQITLMDHDREHGSYLERFTLKT